MFCEIYRDYRRAKRALSLIWPDISYETALDKAALSTLKLTVGQSRILNL